MYNFEPAVTDEEIHLASLQFIRKITGFNKPSKINEEPFFQAVDQVEQVMRRLFSSLQTRAKPRDREKEEKKAKKRFQQRLDRLRDT